jgi:hypothetical protein
VKLHVVDLFIDTALELDPCAECLEDDLRRAWERFANAGWPFERLLEELALRGVTMVSHDKRAIFVGVRLNGFWRWLFAKRKLKDMGIPEMVRSSWP